MELGGNTTAFISAPMMTSSTNVDRNLSKLKRVQILLSSFVDIGTLTTGLLMGLRPHTSELKPVDYELNITQHVTNSTLCIVIKTYVLTPYLKATVCQHRFEGIRLDIRQFVGSKPTIKGIVLSRQSFTACSAVRLGWYCVSYDWCIKSVVNRVGCHYCIVIMADFYLTLPSNSNMEYFPDNKVINFVTKLPKHIQLEGRWEVALVEVQFPFNFYTVNEGDETISLSLFESPNGVIKILISPGYYTNPLKVGEWAKLKEFIQNVDSEVARLQQPQPPPYTSMPDLLQTALDHSCGENLNGNMNL